MTKTKCTVHIIHPVSSPGLLYNTTKQQQRTKTLFFWWMFIFQTLDVNYFHLSLLFFLLSSTPNKHDINNKCLLSSDFWWVGRAEDSLPLMTFIFKALEIMISFTHHFSSTMTTVAKNVEHPTTIPITTKKTLRRNEERIRESAIEMSKESKEQRLSFL